MSTNDMSLRGHAPSRRRDERTPLWRPMSWWVEDADEARQGVLVSASESGLALLMDRDHAPSVGHHIRLGRRSQPGPRRAQVVRVDYLTGTTTRVAAEFDLDPGSPK